MEKETKKLTIGQKPLEYYKKGETVYARVHIFKGESIADPGRKMVRFKVSIQGTVEGVLPADFGVVKDIIEHVDIEFELLELILRELFEKPERVRIIAALDDAHAVSAPGSEIGVIDMPYDSFIKLNSILEMACFKPLETENVF